MPVYTNVSGRWIHDLPKHNCARERSGERAGEGRARRGQQAGSRAPAAHRRVALRGLAEGDDGVEQVLDCHGWGLLVRTNWIHLA